MQQQRQFLLLPDGKKCILKSWISATENVLVAEFNSEMELNLEYDFYFPDEIGKGCDRAADIWGKGESDEIQNGMFVGMVSGRPLQLKKNQWKHRQRFQAIQRPCRYAHKDRICRLFY